MEEYFIPVALIGWVKGISFRPPDYNIGSALKQYVSAASSVETHNLQRTTSDAIVFDFIVDDHDKKRLNGNWATFTDRKDIMLNWDSGIAWNHAPAGKSDESCFSI